MSLTAFLFFVFFLYFRTTLLWIIELFTDKAFYEYGIFFVLVMSIVALIVYKKWDAIKKSWSFSWHHPAAWGLMTMLILDLINATFFHYNILSALFFFLGFYFLLGLFIERSLWKRAAFLVGIIALTLPFIEHIQTFLGFPVRIGTAKLVSTLLGWLGHSTITESTIIFTENTATSIDLPCSGVKSIYIGTLLMFIIFFLKQVRLSWALFLGAFSFYLLLLFFNFWRVFSLVYIVDILGLEAQGDAIHVFLGVVGFVLSVLFLWWFIGRFSETKRAQNTNRVTSSKKALIVLISFIISVDIVSSLYFYIKPTVIQQDQNHYNFDFSQEEFEIIPFTEKEKGFFSSRELQYAQKFRGEIDDLPYALLILTSQSWRTHHNPEICIQGLGHQIQSSKIVQLNGNELRQANLTNDEGAIFYWFVSSDEIISDYSQRIWKGIMAPNQSWSLVVLRVADPDHLKHPDFKTFVKRLNTELTKVDE